MTMIVIFDNPSLQTGGCTTPTLDVPVQLKRRLFRLPLGCRCRLNGKKFPPMIPSDRNYLHPNQIYPYRTVCHRCTLLIGKQPRRKKIMGIGYINCHTNHVPSASGSAICARPTGLSSCSLGTALASRQRHTRSLSCLQSIPRNGGVTSS